MEQFSDQLLISDFSPCPRPRGYLRETGDFSYNTRAYDLAPQLHQTMGSSVPAHTIPLPQLHQTMGSSVPAHTISLPLPPASRSWGFCAVNHLRFLIPTQSPQRSSGNLPELQARTLSLSPGRRPLPPML